MKIAHITTANALNEISILGDIEYCLAPLCKILQYKNYFIEQIKNNRYVIMDDSIAENGGTLTTDEIINLAIEMNISELVIPDVIGDFEKTNVKRKELLDKYYVKLKYQNIKLMGVVQGNTFQEYFDMFKELENDGRIDTIGIPFRIKFYNTDVKYKDFYHAIQRLSFLYIIKDISIKPIHCLGCNNVYEILQLNKTNIRSMDSKILSCYGVNNLLLQETDETKPRDKNLDILKDNLDEQSIEKTIENINKLNQILKNE